MLSNKNDGITTFYFKGFDIQDHTYGTHSDKLEGKSVSKLLSAHNVSMRLEGGQFLDYDWNNQLAFFSKNVGNMAET